MRISDWSSDVCSSDLIRGKQSNAVRSAETAIASPPSLLMASTVLSSCSCPRATTTTRQPLRPSSSETALPMPCDPPVTIATLPRSEEHTSELQSLMRISYAVFCLKNKTHKHN